MASKTENKIVRKRNPNWDDAERSLLRKCLANMIEVIENKCTNTNTNKNKNLAWQKIVQCFNEVNNRPRTLVELKQQWRTMKIDAKKCSSQYKRALKATGGGQKPPSPDPVTSEIMEMLPLEFEEDVNKFDSDTFTQTAEITTHNAESEQKQTDAEKQIKQNEEVASIPIEIFEIEDREIPDTDGHNIFTPEVNYSSEAKTCKRVLFTQSQPSKRKKHLPEAESVLENSKERNRVVIDCLKKESELKITHMTDYHQWAREEHLLKIEEAKLTIENLKLQNLILKRKLE